MKNKKELKDKLQIILLYLVIGLFGVTFIFLTFFNLFDEHMQSQIRIHPNEYVWYIDNTQVEYQAINLNNYDVRYNMNKKEIYLQKKY